VRWEAPIRWRLSGRNLPAHRDMVERALNAVGQAAGVPVTEAGQGERVNLRIEIVADTALEDRQPCVTTLDFQTETRIDAARVQMRERDVTRCAHHEAMHVMGVRGHPAGHTVLSYFPVKVDSLLPLDRALLRAWYSPRMHPGMTPFEALPVLASEWQALQADQAQAVQARDRFFATTVAEAKVALAAFLRVTVSPTVKLPAVTVTVREAFIVTAPVPMFRFFVPAKVKLPFQFCALLFVRVMLPALVLSSVPPVMVSVPVPIAVAWLSTRVPALTVVAPL
jgi:hypothetical protein